MIELVSVGEGVAGVLTHTDEAAVQVLERIQVEVLGMGLDDLRQHRPEEDATETRLPVGFLCVFVPHPEHVTDGAELDLVVPGHEQAHHLLPGLLVDHN